MNVEDRYPLQTVDYGETKRGLPTAILTAPYKYSHGSEATGIHVVVPEGFATNYASIPWAVRWLISPTGQHRHAAVVHDYLYSHEADCDRFMADATFRVAMKDHDVSLWKRVVIYYAVRIGGWAAYQLDKPPE